MDRMTLPPEIFKAYDVRGIVGRSLTPPIVEAIGQAVGSEALARRRHSAVIGRDGRLSGPELSAALAHNRSHDAFIFVRGNRMPNGNYTEGGFGWVRDNFPVEGRPTGYTGRLNIGSSEGEQRYTALYLTADKTYTKESGWGATASLTLSDAKSNQAIAFDEG